MSNIVHPPTKIVIDAGVAIWTVLPLMSTINMVSRLVTWREAGIELYAPALWLAETTSVIRRAVSTKLITLAEGRTALDDVIALDITVTAMTPAHCRSALAWADRLGQAKAYDGFYLALAEELNAPFYTTDQRLANGAHQKGVAWVLWIGATGIQ